MFTNLAKSSIHGRARKRRRDGQHDDGHQGERRMGRGGAGLAWVETLSDPIFMDDPWYKHNTNTVIYHEISLSWYIMVYIMIDPWYIVMIYDCFKEYRLMFKQAPVFEVLRALKYHYGTTIPSISSSINVLVNWWIGDRVDFCNLKIQTGYIGYIYIYITHCFARYRLAII